MDQSQVVSKDEACRLSALANSNMSLFRALRTFSRDSVARQLKEIIMTMNKISSSRPTLAQAGEAGALSVICGLMAFIALTSAMPVAPAHAQSGSAPAGLLRLDSSQPRPIAEGELAAARDAFARMGDEDLAAARSFCVQRFISYDPGSGTYLGHDGRRHSCP